MPASPAGSTSTSVKARNATGAKCLSMISPRKRRPRRGMLGARSRPRRAGIAARHRRIRGKIVCVRARNAACVARANRDMSAAMKVAGKHYAQHLAGGRRRGRRRHRPDAAAASLRHNPARNITGCGARDRDDAGARRAADRGDRGLRHLPGAARRRLRRSAGARLCGAARDAADRDQSEMGARRDDGGGAQPPARGARRRGLSARGRDLRRGRRDQPGDRPPRPAS